MADLESLVVSGTSDLQGAVTIPAPAAGSNPVRKTDLDAETAARTAAIAVETAARTAAVAGKAASSHTHAIADSTGLQAALDGKAASSHTHAIADSTGLQAALDGKAASSHTHAQSEVTGLVAALAALGVRATALEDGDSLGIVDVANEAERKALALKLLVTSSDSLYAGNYHYQDGTLADAAGSSPSAWWLGPNDRRIIVDPNDGNNWMVFNSDDYGAGGAGTGPAWDGDGDLSIPPWGEDVGSFGYFVAPELGYDFTVARVRLKRGALVRELDSGRVYLLMDPDYAELFAPNSYSTSAAWAKIYDPAWLTVLSAEGNLAGLADVAASRGNLGLHVLTGAITAGQRTVTMLFTGEPWGVALGAAPKVFPSALNATDDIFVRVVSVSTTQAVISQGGISSANTTVTLLVLV